MHEELGREGRRKILTLAAVLFLFYTTVHSSSPLPTSFCSRGVDTSGYFGGEGFKVLFLHSEHVGGNPPLYSHQINVTVAFSVMLRAENTSRKMDTRVLFYFNEAILKKKRVIHCYTQPVMLCRCQT